MDYTNIDRTKLSDLQRRNLAAWQLKQYEVKQQYGNNVQIATTLDEILNSNRPMTIPMSALPNDKQVSILMEELREDVDGTVRLVHERGEMPIADGVSDITRALETQVDLLRELEEKRTKRARKSREFVVPEGYKLVKIEDDVPVSPAVTAAADILAGDTQGTVVKDDLGVVIPKEAAPALTREQAAKALLDMLM